MDTNWSIEAIQERAANNWSLEGDNQLLNLMKSISKNLEQRCLTSNNNLNRLMLDVDKTKIKLGNATTKLLDLNNAKFVEHTVMDMDSSLSNTEKCSTAENDRILVPLPKAVEAAVTNGLNMMDRCYEKVLLNLEDSDEEDNENEQKHVVCRPKNPYLNRPLPHLIGSAQWNDKWHIGLIESDEEVLSDEEPEEEFSQSSSEEEDSISVSPQTSNRPSTSESDFAARSVIPQDDLIRRFQQEKLFAPEDKKQDEKIKVLPTVVPSTQTEPKSDSIDKPKQLIVQPVPSSEQPKQTIFVQRKPEQQFLNLFDDEPPVLDEPVHSERKPVNLFLDSDDDDDPVKNVKRPSSIFNNNNVVDRPSHSFSTPQVDNHLTQTKSKNDADNNNVSVVSSSQSKSALKSNDFGGLFDDEPPDDFFDIIVREQGTYVDNKKPEKPKLHTKTVNLFDSDDDDEDDFSKIIGTSKKNDTKVSPLNDVENIVRKTDTGKSTSKIKSIEQTDVTLLPYNSSPFKSFQNAGPPKSYVSFLDDDSLSFDDDKPTESHAISIPDSKKSIFDDTPPDDVIVTSVTSNRKSPAKIIYDDIAETIQENNSAPPSSISGQNLFDDTPPDDTITPPVALPRKTLPKPIRDNVADSLLKPTSQLSDVNSFPVAKQETKSDNGDTKDETDQSHQSLSFKKNLSMFSNPEVTNLPPVEKEMKPKPNKLKTNFNINVAALLPGAKLPSQKQSTTTAKQEDESEPEKIENISADKVIPSGSPPQINSANSEDSSGRLACLSKNRAKIQVQRRPSTRTGRQSLYKKSLIADTEAVVSIETTDSVSSKTNMVEQVIDTTPSHEDIDWLTESTEQPPPMDSNDPKVDEDEEDWLKTIDEKPSSPSKTNLYEDDDWLSAKSVKTEQKSSTHLSHVMNYDWLTASSLPPEDIYNPPSAIDDEQDDWLSSYVAKEKSTVVSDLPIDDDDWLISTKRQSPEVVSTVADTKKEEEEDWLLKTTLKSETNDNEKVDENKDDWLSNSLTFAKTSTNKVDKISVPDVVNTTRAGVSFVDKSSDLLESNTETTKTFKSKLFDSDDDNNVTDVSNSSRPKLDFGSESSNIFEPKSETKNFLNSTLFDDDVVPPTKAPSISKMFASSRKVESPDIFKPETDTNKSLGSKLFEDDDDDDDDLFTSISKQKSVEKRTNSNPTEAVKTTKNVSIKGKSLFSDDDSDPDDLFGTTKSMKKQNEKIATVDKPKMSKTTKSGLFDDDDDDDDDIFSSKTSKQRAVQSDTKKRSSVSKLVATIPATNDPLADLLK